MTQDDIQVRHKMAFDGFVGQESRVKHTKILMDGDTEKTRFVSRETDAFLLHMGNLYAMHHIQEAGAEVVYWRVRNVSEVMEGKL